jgi:hypothetical protein
VPGAQHVPPRCSGDVARLPRIQRRTSVPLPARARRASPARCRGGAGGAGAHVLVLWAGRDASGDTWEPLERQTNCEAALIAFEQASWAGRALPQCLAPHSRLPLPPHRRSRFSRQVSPSTRLRRGTWGRRSWAGSCSTGDRTTAGSVAQPPVSARAAGRVLTRCGVHAPDVGAARHG